MRERIPIYPAPTRSAGRGRAGFTLVELLVALVVCMLLVGVAGRSLFAILRAEESANQMRDGTLVVGTVSCESFLGGGKTGITARLGPAYEVDVEPFQTTEAQTNDWLIWTIAPKESAKISVVLAFETDGDSW